MYVVFVLFHLSLDFYHYYQGNSNILPRCPPRVIPHTGGKVTNPFVIFVVKIRSANLPRKLLKTTYSQIKYIEQNSTHLPEPIRSVLLPLVSVAYG